MVEAFGKRIAHRRWASRHRVQRGHFEGQSLGLLNGPPTTRFLLVRVRRHRFLQAFGEPFQLRVKLADCGIHRGTWIFVQLGQLPLDLRFVGTTRFGHDKLQVRAAGHLCKQRCAGVTRITGSPSPPARFPAEDESAGARAGHPTPDVTDGEPESGPGGQHWCSC